MNRSPLRNLLCALALLAVSLGALAQTPAPIRVGTTQSLSGRFEDAGTEQLRGLQMWVHDINARGELLGRPVELVYYDDRSDPERSAALYRKLIEVDKVDLLVGPYSSDLTLAATEVAEDHDFPVLTAGASAESIWDRGYHNVIGIDVPASNYLDPLLETAAARGASTLALLRAGTAFDEEAAQGARSRAAALGLRIVLDERYDLARRDFSALAQQVAAANPDVVAGLSYLDDSIALVRALKAAGARPRMLAFTVGPGLHEFGDTLGAEAEGVVGVVQWLRSAHLPGGQDFAYRYRQLYGYNPGVYATMGYAAGQITEAAVRLAGSLEHTAVRDQYLNMDFSSLLGRYRVDPKTGRQLGKHNYLLQWQDGDRRLVEPAWLAERQLIYPLP